MWHDKMFHVTFSLNTTTLEACLEGTGRILYKKNMLMSFQWLTFPFLLKSYALLTFFLTIETCKTLVSFFFATFHTDHVMKRVG